MNKPPHFDIVNRAPASLRPYDRNARKHSAKQIRQIADSISRFGFTNPVLVSDDGEIIAGHGRVQAAKLLGLDSVPTLQLSHLNETERRAYVLADNKLALNAGWDQEMLAIELQALLLLELPAVLGRQLLQLGQSGLPVTGRDPFDLSFPHSTLHELRSITRRRAPASWRR